MHFHLVRHGIAEDIASSDRARVLTPEGIRKTARALRGFVPLLGEAPRILSSPYPRARQTADLLVEAVGGPVAVEETDALAIGGDREAVVAEVIHGPAAEDVVVVGHQPQLGSLASWLLTGGEGLRVWVKKASVLSIAFPGHPRPASGELLWYLPPRVLRTLGDRA